MPWLRYPAGGHGAIGLNDARTMTPGRASRFPDTTETSPSAGRRRRPGRGADPRRAPDRVRAAGRAPGGSACQASGLPRVRASRGLLGSPPRAKRNSVPEERPLPPHGDDTAMHHRHGNGASGIIRLTAFGRKGLVVPSGPATFVDRRLPYQRCPFPVQDARFENRPRQADLELRKQPVRRMPLAPTARRPTGADARGTGPLARSPSFLHLLRRDRFRGRRPAARAAAPGGDRPVDRARRNPPRRGRPARPTGRALRLRPGRRSRASPPVLAV